jgi:hypothetical protein
LEAPVTYTELRDILRRDLLAEVSQDYWSDNDLFDFLKRAATEVAHELAFPTSVAIVPVAEGDTSFSLPADAASAQLNEVAFGGMRLTLAPMAVISEYQALGALRFPRYYNVDPKRNPALVFIAPPAPAGGANMMVEYIVDYDASPESIDSEPWLGLFRRYHELVAYRAAVKAFESSLEPERAQYMSQRSQQLLQSFALFLGKADMAQAIAGEGVAAS